jgi:pentatricopeptide repeat protein
MLFSSCFVGRILCLRISYYYPKRRSYIPSIVPFSCYRFYSPILSKHATSHSQSEDILSFDDIPSLWAVHDCTHLEDMQTQAVNNQKNKVETDFFKKIVQSSSSVEVEAIVNEMTQKNFRLNETTYYILIKHFMEHLSDHKRALKYFQQMKENGFLPNLRIYHVLLKYLPLKLAQQIFNELLSPDAQHQPRLIDYTVMIRRCCIQIKLLLKKTKRYQAHLNTVTDKTDIPDENYESNNVDEYPIQPNEEQTKDTVQVFQNLALQYWKLMEKNNIKPDIYAYNTILDCVSPQVAKQIFDNMPKRNVSPNLASYEIVIQKLLEAQQFSDVLELFEAMVKNIQPSNIFIYRVMIEQLPLNLAENFALKHLKIAKDTNLRLQIFVSLTIKFLRAKLDEKALIYIEKMRKENLLPNVYAVTQLIPFLPLTLAETLIQEMHEYMENKNIKDIIAYLAILNRYANERDEKKLLYWWERMNDRGIWPILEVYNILLKGLSIEKAEKIFNDLIQRYDKDGQFTFTLNQLIEKYLASGFKEKAQQLFEYLKSKKRTSKFTYEVALRFVDSFQGAEQLFHEMLAMGHPPTTRALNFVIRKALQEMNREKAMFFFQKFQHLNLKPNLHTYIYLISYAENSDEAVGYYQQFRNTAPHNINLLTVLIRRLADNHDYSQALYWFDQVIEAELPLNYPIFTLITHLLVQIKDFSNSTALANEQQSGLELRFPLREVALDILVETYPHASQYLPQQIEDEWRHWINFLQENDKIKKEDLEKFAAFLNSLISAKTLLDKMKKK